MKSLVTILRQLSCFLLLCSLLISCSSENGTNLFFSSMEEAEADHLDHGVNHLPDSLLSEYERACDLMCFIGVRDGFGYFARIDTVPMSPDSIFCSTTWFTVPEDYTDPLYQDADLDLGYQEVLAKYEEIRENLNAHLGAPNMVLNMVDYKDENEVLEGEYHDLSMATWSVNGDPRWTVTLNFRKFIDEVYMIDCGLSSPWWR